MEKRREEKLKQKTERSNSATAEEQERGDKGAATKKRKEGGRVEILFSDFVFCFCDCRFGLSILLLMDVVVIKLMACDCLVEELLMAGRRKPNGGWLLVWKKEGD